MKKLAPRSLSPGIYGEPDRANRITRCRARLP